VALSQAEALLSGTASAGVAAASVAAAMRTIPAVGAQGQARTLGANAAASMVAVRTMGAVGL